MKKMTMEDSLFGMPNSTDLNELSKQIEFFEIDVNKIEVTLRVLRAVLRKNKEFRKTFAQLVVDMSNGLVTKKQFVKSVELHTRQKIDVDLFEKAYLFCSQYDLDFKRAWYSNSSKLKRFRIRVDDFVDEMAKEIIESLAKLKKQGILTKKEEK